MNEIQVTVRGTTHAEISKNLNAAAAAFAAANAPGTTTGRTSTKRAAPQQEPQEDNTDLDGLDASPEETTEVDETTFDEMPEEIAPPKAKAKTKLTDKDVNNAAMAYAKKHGKPATMKILTGKFKVKSILELKPEQYQTVITALKV